jgi:hypothetical protein
LCDIIGYSYDCNIGQFFLLHIITLANESLSHIAGGFGEDNQGSSKQENKGRWKEEISLNAQRGILT